MKSKSSGRGLASGNAGHGLGSGGLLGGTIERNMGSPRGGVQKPVKSTERTNKETPTKMKDTGLS